jgi:hypothetical protein
MGNYLPGLGCAESGAFSESYATFEVVATMTSEGKVSL